MLCPAEADLILREPELPGLRVVLDPDAFAELLQSRLRGTVVRGIKDGYVHYKPGNSCLGSYELRVEGQVVRVYVRAYRRSDRAKIEKHAALPQVAGAMGPGRFYMEDLALLVTVFPNDVRLPVLARLADDQRRRELFHRVFRGRFDPSGAEVICLGYKPERRFVAALRESGSERAVVKFYDWETFAPAKAKLFRSSEILRVAKRLGRCKRHRIVAYEWLPGRLLRDELVSGRATPHDLEHVGAAVAELHTEAVEPSMLPEIRHASLAKRVATLAWFVGCVFPSAAHRAATLAERIIERLRHEPRRLAPIHGDLNEKQVLLAGDRVGLVDFDESAMGDPAIDLGNFLGYSYYDHGMTPGRLPAETVRDAVLEGYRWQAGPMDANRFNLYLAMSLLRIAPRGFRTRDPHWPERLEAVLARAESLLDGQHVHSSVPRAVCAADC